MNTIVLNRKNNKFDNAITLSNNKSNNYEFINLSNIGKKTNKSYIDELIEKTKASILPWTIDNKKKQVIINIEEPTYKLIGITPEILNLEWNKAATILENYFKYINKPTYDFLIGDTPVKMHGNYIQVGTDIIPKHTLSSYFYKMNNADKIKLYIISMNINSLEIELAA